MIEVPEIAYSSKVLDRERHFALVQSLEKYVRVANIPAHMVWTSSKGICSEGEVNFIRRLRKNALEGSCGLVYTGVAGPKVKPVATRMMALAGVCLRNYIDGRVIVLADLLDGLKAEADVNPTVLFIPDFYINKAKLPDWRLSALYSLLINRQAQSRLTFLYVEDMEAMAKAYGAQFRAHLENNFERAE